MSLFGRLFATSKERRDVRRLDTDETQEVKLDLKEQAAEAQGQVPKVVLYMHQIDQKEHDEVLKLFDVFVQVRLLTLRHLQTLDRLRTTVLHEIKDKEKQEATLKELEEYRKKITASINNAFVAFTSIESGGLQLEQRLLGVASQTRDLLNAVKTQRPAERKLRKAESSIEHGNFKYLKVYSKELTIELLAINKTTTYGIAVLKRVKERIASHEKHVQSLITDAGFPPLTGKEIVQEFDHTLQFTQQNLTQAVNEYRLQLSTAAQLK